MAPSSGAHYTGGDGRLRGTMETNPLYMILLASVTGRVRYALKRD